MWRFSKARGKHGAAVWKHGQACLELLSRMSFPFYSPPVAWEVISLGEQVPEEEPILRILSGEWAGITLVSPGGRVRPSAEELRGAWMEWLSEELPEARVLDLFSGTGALGLEALSRGAASVDFVENGPPALHALKSNVAKLRATKRTRLFKRDVFAFLDGVDALSYDLALADPPYASGLADRLASQWLERPFSRILSIEHDAARTLPRGGQRRVLGDTAVTTYRIKKTGSHRGRGSSTREPATHPAQRNHPADRPPRDPR